MQGGYRVQRVQLHGCLDFYFYVEVQVCILKLK
jgi:hypothetical protein